MLFEQLMCKSFMNLEVRTKKLKPFESHFTMTKRVHVWSLQKKSCLIYLKSNQVSFHSIPQKRRERESAAAAEEEEKIRGRKNCNSIIEFRCCYFLPYNATNSFRRLIEHKQQER